MAPVTITRTHWIDDDGTGTTGTIINDAAKQEIYGQIDAALALVQPSADIGTWLDVPFAASNFFPPAGTWTVTSGQININRYTRIGAHIVVWVLRLQSSTVGGGPQPFLYLRPPVWPIKPWNTTPASRCVQAGSWVSAEVYMDAGSACFVLAPATTIPNGSLDLAFTVLYEC